jgi:hypothetical protein
LEKVAEQLPTAVVREREVREKEAEKVRLELKLRERIKEALVKKAADRRAAAGVDGAAQGHPEQKKLSE